MRNLLRLHEAVAVILLTKAGQTATFVEIADAIEKRGLFPIRKGGISLAKQIEIRTTIASSKYKHLFKFTRPDTLTLK